MKRLFLIPAFVGMPLLAQQPLSTQVLRDVFPADTNAEQFALSTDIRRTYYLNHAGEVWLYDRDHKANTRVTTGNPWDLSLSPRGDALLYTKAGDGPSDRYVWVTPLDIKTGLPAGADRRLSPSEGDVPSISPDGRWVAFARNDTTGVGQSVVVMPLAGGVERVVAAAMPSTIDNIRWTPDGKTLFFGVNPPVDCVPDWSCLPVPRADKIPKATIRRVAVSGGPVRIVVTGRAASPGLSPDGTLLVYADTVNPRRWVVADTNGRRVQDLPFPPTQVVPGWLSGSTLLIRESGVVQQVRSISLSGGGPRTLVETSDILTEPSWSSDGKMFCAVMRFLSVNKIELRIFNADGSLRSTLPLPDIGANLPTWSPDQRSIAYAGAVDAQTRRLQMIDVASGRVTDLLDMSQSASLAFTWLPDSRGIIASDFSRGAGPNRRVTFRRVDLSGGTTVLREIALGDVPSVGAAIDATTAVVARPAERDYRLVPLTGGGAERPIQTGLTGVNSGPTFSADRQWVAFRRGASTNDLFNMIDIMRADGSAQSRVKLSFPAGRGATNLAILPGGKEVIVVEQAMAPGDVGVYQVDVATGSAKKLLAYSPRIARTGPPEVAVSPDGRTLLVATWVALAPTISAVDLTPLKNSTRR